MTPELEAKIKEWQAMPPVPEEEKGSPTWVHKFRQWRKNKDFVKSKYHGSYRKFVESDGHFEEEESG